MKKIGLFSPTGFTGRLALKHLMASYGIVNHLIICCRQKSAYLSTLRKVAIYLIHDVMNAPYPLYTDYTQKELISKEERVAQLADILEFYEKGVEILEVNFTKKETLQKMVDSCSVIMNTVGPYSRYYTDFAPMVLNSDCVVVDLCAELVQLKAIDEMQRKNDSKKGAFIFCSGLDSIPSEIVAYKNPDLPELYGVVWDCDGTLSGGTIATIRQSIKDGSSFAVGDNPSFLCRGMDTPKYKVGSISGMKTLVPKRDYVDSYLMTSINVNAVQKSRELLGRKSEQIYKEGWRYSGRRAAYLQKFGMMFCGLMLFIPLVSDFFTWCCLYRPGQGPADPNKGSYHMKGVNKDGKSLTDVISPGGDPGYSETSRLLLDVAFLVYKDLEEGSFKRLGNIATPVATLGF